MSSLMRVSAPVRGIALRTLASVGTGGEQAVTTHMGLDPSFIQVRQQQTQASPTHKDHHSQHSEQSLWQKLIHSFKVERLSNDDKERYKKMFIAADGEKNGGVNKKHMAKLLKELWNREATAQEIMAIFNETNRSGSGILEIDEFYRVMSELETVHIGQVITHLDDAFSKFDKNKDGHISLQELEEVLAASGDPTLTPEAAEKMFSHADRDADGKVSYRDFITMMLKKTP